MNASLRALLTNLIDYAGLFPPAQLTLHEASENYAAYRDGTDAWMLGRFVCPAARLSDLADFPPLSVVGRGGSDVTDLLNGLKKDLDDLLELRHRQPSAMIDAYEVRISNELVLSERAGSIWNAVLEPVKLLAGDAVGLKEVFFELEYGPRWPASVESMIPVLADRGQPRKGLKIRCGGATAASVPSSESVAFALATCCRSKVPVKFTAGLHHPLRRHDTTLGTKTHGFLNVFVAGALARARGLDAKALHPIIEDDDASHFGFEDGGVRWKSLFASTADVTAARKDAVISIGSCSFDEPRDDLRALGLMD
jgi:hypothetical protein